MFVIKPAMGADYRPVDSFLLHLGPFSRHVIRQIERQLDAPQNLATQLTKADNVIAPADF